MSDYISREDAVDELQVKVFHDLTDEYYGTMQVLTELPAADVVPVEILKAEIYKLKDTPTRFEEGWTLGDMQYRLPDSGTTPTLLYPVFSENDNYSLNISDGKTLSTESGVKRVDAAKVSDYSDIFLV